jgi:hypothetical protein
MLTEIEAMDAQYQPFVIKTRDLVDLFALQSLASWLEILI